MSSFMIDDENTINDINPFVVKDFSLPGAWANPYKFAEYTQPVEDVQGPFRDEVSPICSYGVTAGDKTADLCNPQKPNCPMRRPLYPERVIQYDNGKVNTDTYKIRVTPESDRYVFIFVVALIILILIISLR